MDATVEHRPALAVEDALEVLPAGAVRAPRGRRPGDSPSTAGHRPDRAPGGRTRHARRRNATVEIGPRPGGAQADIDALIAARGALARDRARRGGRRWGSPSGCAGAAGPHPGPARFPGPSWCNRARRRGSHSARSGVAWAPAPSATRWRGWATRGSSMPTDRWISSIGRSTPGARLHEQDQAVVQAGGIERGEDSGWHSPGDRVQAVAQRVRVRLEHLRAARRSAPRPAGRRARTGAARNGR